MPINQPLQKRRSDRTSAHAALDRGDATRGNASIEAGRNRLLGSLPESDFTLLARHLMRVTLNHGAILQEQDAPVERVYFPLSGAVSFVAMMQNGEAVETALVGREGAV